MIPTFYVVIPNDAVHEHVWANFRCKWLYESEQKAVAYAKKLAEQGNDVRVYKLIETHFFEAK